MLCFLVADTMKLLAVVKKGQEGYSNSVLLYAHALALCPFLLITQGF